MSKEERAAWQLADEKARTVTRLERAIERLRLAAARELGISFSFHAKETSQ